MTLICIVILVLSVITGFSLGFQPDLGVIAFGLGAVLALCTRRRGLKAFAGSIGRRSSWSEGS